MPTRWPAQLDQVGKDVTEGEFTKLRKTDDYDDVEWDNGAFTKLAATIA